MRGQSFTGMQGEEVQAPLVRQPLSDARGAKRQCKTNPKIFRSSTSLFWGSGRQRLLSDGASKSKSMCWILSEARQTKMMQFGAEKGFIAGSSENRWLMLKRAPTPRRVLAEHF